MKIKGRRYKSGETLLADRIKGREQRFQHAYEYRCALQAEVRKAGGDPDTPSVAALIASAVSCESEISRTLHRFLVGCVRDSHMERLQGARSELRRCLRSLGLIRALGEETDEIADANSPPPNASDEEKRRWSQSYVENLSKGAAQ